MKPAAPRSAKMPTIATGTIHSASLPALKPWSSKGFISSGISGSVAAPTSEPTKATTMPIRPWRKYGVMRAKRCNKVGMGWGELGRQRAGIGQPGRGACSEPDYPARCAPQHGRLWWRADSLVWLASNTV